MCVNRLVLGFNKSTECKTKCPGDEGETCGGEGSVSVRRAGCMYCLLYCFWKRILWLKQICGISDILYLCKEAAGEPFWCYFDHIQNMNVVRIKSCRRAACSTDLRAWHYRTLKNSPHNSHIILDTVTYSYKQTKHTMTTKYFTFLG